VGFSDSHEFCKIWVDFELNKYQENSQLLFMFFTTTLPAKAKQFRYKTRLNNPKILKLIAFHSFNHAAYTLPLLSDFSGLLLLWNIESS